MTPPIIAGNVILGLMVEIFNYRLQSLQERSQRIFSPNAGKPNL
jgi:hypothetical protein